jgi:hypothetical protein
VDRQQKAADIEDIEEIEDFEEDRYQDWLSNRGLEALKRTPIGLLAIKLRVIAATMVEKDKFESVFSRVMCLLPQDALQSLLLNSPNERAFMHRRINANCYCCIGIITSAH